MNFSKRVLESFGNLTTLALVLLTNLSAPGHAESFSVDQMPIGAEVTVPPSAKTTVPMGTRVKISSTDTPQTIQIVPIGNGTTFATAIQLAIFDSKLDRVKYISVSPNAPFLYSFQGLASISIVPSIPKGNSIAKNIRIQIESDKAVTFAR